MRILFIATQIPYPATNGGKLSVMGLVKALSDRGHQIDFLSYKTNRTAEDLEEFMKFCKLFSVKHNIENNILGAVVNLFSPVPYNVSKYYSKKMAIKLNKYLEENNPDIVHVSQIHMAWTLEILRRKVTVPIILRQENLEMYIMKRFYEIKSAGIVKIYAKMQYHKFIKYEPYYCGKFDHCIMISKKDEERLKKLNPACSVSTITIGVNKNLIKTSCLRKEEFSLVHIGSMDWFPNFDSLNWFINSILPDLIKLNKKYKLYIFGGGDYSKLTIPENIIENIIFNGFVDNLWKELESKALAVIPLRIGSGIRVKLLEMQAFGINIITTDIGKEGLNAKDSEELLIANTKEEFIYKISSFFDNKYDRKRLIANSQKKIKNEFVWEIISMKFEKKYLNLINKKNI